MKKLKHALFAAGMALSLPSFAGFVDIGGLNVPTGAHLEVASVFENGITGNGQTLSGYGEVTSMNGMLIPTLCTDCELTFTFTGYVSNSFSPTAVNFTGGTVQLWLGFGANNDFNPFTSASNAADLAAASNGTLFMTLSGHPVDAAGNTLKSTITGTLGTPSFSGTGAGLWDVATGPGCGIACGNFDTDSIAAAFGSPFADILFTSSFNSLVLPHGNSVTCATTPTGPACVAGSLDARGLVIPEPNSLALLGLSLLGLVGLGKLRRQN